MAASRPRPAYQLLVVFLLLALAVLAAVYRYGARQDEAVETEIRGHLLNLADLKVELLSDWRKHRLGEMHAILSSPGAIDSFGRLIARQGTPAERARLEGWFGEVCRDLPFGNLILVDLHGNVVAASGKPLGNAAHLARVAAESAAREDPLLTDFHIDEGGGASHLGLNAPLRRAPGAPAFGALLAAVNADAEVYPMLQTWVGPGSTGETLLVRRDGQDALFLNPLRYSPDPVLRHRERLTHTGRIAVQAIAGLQGSLTGLDYRDVPVLAAARPVPGTNWFLIVKMDRREALAPLLQDWIYLGGFALGLILAAGAGVVWLWRRHEVQFFEARLQAEETLGIVLEASPAAIVAVDSHDRVIIWNKAAEELFGWTAAEAVGQEIPCVPADCQSRYHDFRTQLQQGGVIRGATAEGLRKDGSRIGMSLSRGLMRDASGSVIGDMAVLYDITAQRRAEDALHASEALLRAAFHQAAVGMAHVRLDGHFLRVNRRYSEIAGYSEAELLDRSCRDLTHPDDWEGEEEKLQRLISGSIEEDSCEKRYIRKDGAVVWIRRTMSVVRARTGQPLHLMAAIEDITERVYSQQELSQSESRLRQLVEHAPEGIAVVRDLTYRYVNPALARLLGMDAGALIGQPALARLQAEDRASVERLYERFLKGESFPPCELHSTTASGRPLIVEVSAAPVEYDGQRAALVFFRDITRRKHDEEEHSRLEMQLQQSQKMESIGRLAGGVSHDFNNLLTIINGYAEMLLAEAELPLSTRDALEEIRAAGTRASSLTQQLLAFSRKQIAEPRVLNLNGVVRESERMLRRLIGENVEIVSQLAADLDCVMADRGQMHQVLMNLVVNARDAMPRGGRITIQTGNASVQPDAASSHPDAVPGPYVALSVSDTGIGMSEDTMRQVFEPFFTTKARSAGTGLGLSTVYGIVKHSGGWIEVSSQVGLGSTFRVCLPATASPAETSPAAPAGGANSSQAHPGPGESRDQVSGVETVMVVEDQDQVRRMVLAILRQNGYRLLEAADGTDALSVCETYGDPIHLLITDVIMPGMNGVELSGRMRRLRPALKTLYISGYTADVLAPSGVLSSGFSYLSKPFSPADLSRKVREVLGARVSAQILVIDDDAAVRSLLDRLLSDSGYEVFLAPDGDAALRIARERAIDIAITDLVMPGREGLETIPLLRSLHPEMSIVAISGAFGGQYLQAARLLGADWTLPKPVDREELLAVVRDLLARHEKRPVGNLS